MLRLFAAMLLLAVASPAWCAATWPNQSDRTVVIKDFHFGTGEVLPELKLRYITLGTAKRNAAGELVNGVLLHDTGGTSASWLVPSLADELFSPGAPLDAEKSYIIVTDGVGRGGSSKPSDGLRMKFPHYRYVDMASRCYRRSRGPGRANCPATRHQGDIEAHIAHGNLSAAMVRSGR
jgi:homoserine O-acetyltransferase